MYYTNGLKDVLHNLSMRENDNQNMSKEKIAYYRGIIIGAKATLMMFMSLEKAEKMIRDCLPTDCVIKHF